MAHDVFISHAAEDKAIAARVCAALESTGLRCWIAPRDVRPGSDWGASIVAGIRGARAMVLVFSEHANKSPHVPLELTHAIESGVGIIPFRIQNVGASGGLAYSLVNVQWLDAVSPPLETHIEELSRLLRSFLGPTDLDTVPVDEGKRGMEQQRPRHPSDAAATGHRRSNTESPIARAKSKRASRRSRRSTRRRQTKRPGSPAPTTYRSPTIWDTPTLAIATAILAATITVYTAARIFITAAPGFDTRGVAMLPLELPSSYTAPQAAQFFSSALQRWAALPGVEVVAATDAIPSRNDRPATVVARNSGPRVPAVHRHVMGDYFRTLRIPIILGRDFVRGDDTGTSNVMIFNRSLATRIGEPAQLIGAEVSIREEEAAPPVTGTLVGIVDQTPSGRLERSSEDQPCVYTLASRASPSKMIMLARVSSNTTIEALSAALQREIATLDRQLSVPAIADLRRVVTATMRRTGFSTQNILLAAISLLLWLGALQLLTIRIRSYR